MRSRLDFRVCRFAGYRLSHANSADQTARDLYRLERGGKAGLRQAFQTRRATGGGVDFVREGDLTKDVTLMIGGLGYRYKQLPDGRRQIVSYLLPGDIVSSGTLAADRFDHSIHMMQPSIMSSVHHLDLLTLYPNLMRGLWSIVARELAIAQEWVVNVGQRDAQSRLAHLFCELYYRMLEIGQVQDGSFPLPASQQELADSVGITNVHANRTLQNLRKQGVTAFDGKTLTILNIAGLRRIGLFDAGYLHLERSGALRVALPKPTT